MNNIVARSATTALADRPAPTAVVSAPQSDSHTWNLVFLHLYLQELGFAVVNLGPCAPDQLIVNECANLLPDIVLISSVNGHGFNDGIRLARAFRNQAELQYLPLAIGGKLGVQGKENNKHIPELLESGFDAVFDDNTDFTQFRQFLGALRLQLEGS